MKRSSGYTLIELMIAITIGLLVSAGLVTMFGSTSAQRAELDRVSRLMENSRFAADMMGDDLHHAGFYGTFGPSNTVQWRDDPSPCQIAVNDATALGWNPSVNPVQMPAPIRGYNDPLVAASEISCLTNLKPSNDVIIVRRASSLPYSAAATNNKNLYVQVSQCPDDATTFGASNNISDLTLRNVKCNGTSQRIARFFSRAYYIASCNECAPSDGIPTLKRLEMRDGVLTSTALAEGVERLQVEYGFDIDGDGTPDTFLPYVTATGAATDQWANVVAVRLHVLVRSTEPSQSLDDATHTFNLGPSHETETCPSGYRCRLVTTTIRLNNVAGRREVS
ncbi:MAG TPA: PilW family protein [Burkholderiaceae bacterium]|nr:PilW family protein [Burkholderiaceae bacterium]